MKFTAATITGALLLSAAFVGCSVEDEAPYTVRSARVGDDAVTRYEIEVDAQIRRVERWRMNDDQWLRISDDLGNFEAIAQWDEQDELFYDPAGLEASAAGGDLVQIDEPRLDPATQLVLDLVFDDALPAPVGFRAMNDPDGGVGDPVKECKDQCEEDCPPDDLKDPWNCPNGVTACKKECEPETSFWYPLYIW